MKMGTIEREKSVLRRYRPIIEQHLDPVQVLPKLMELDCIQEAGNKCNITIITNFKHMNNFLRLQI